MSADQYVEFKGHKWIEYQKTAWQPGRFAQLTLLTSQEYEDLSESKREQFRRIKEFDLGALKRAFGEEL